jgi:hypothetical protein
MRYPVWLAVMLLIGALGLATAVPVRTLAAAPVSRAGRESALASIVQVVVETRFGTTRRCSGYLFNSSGNIVTAFHVISDAVRIQVRHADYGVFDVAAVKRIDQRVDVAVLRLAGADEMVFDNALLADSRSVLAGDNVFVLHHPAYSDDVQYDTTVAQVGYPQQLGLEGFLQSYPGELPFLELHGPFDSGSAGGIVCNDHYQIVGLIIGGWPGASPPTAFALSASYLANYLNSTFDVAWEKLRTSAMGDASYFDTFLGPSPQLCDFQEPMPEAYIAWFSPLRHTALPDAEFTSEINDKIDKNWFYSSGLVVDGRPLREWSASRLLVWPASINPWVVSDSREVYVHFDADSLFGKRVYRNLETEERIMTRHIFALALPPGDHTLQYENKGANYKSTGLKRQHVDLSSAQVELLDIQGLSLVSMTLLPNAVPGVGEAESVRYELERRPILEKEVNFGIRSVRYPLTP